MRMRLKGRIYQLPSGEWKQWPETREEAFKQGTVYYHPPRGTIPCIDPAHGNSSVIFTISNVHACCSHNIANTEYLAALDRGEPTDPNNAARMGLDYYWRMVRGRYCGHPGKYTINGQCWYCTEERKNHVTPRQQAILAGETWYMPAEGDLCKKGHHAPRRVANGTCKECESEARSTGTDNRYHEGRIDRQFPDMTVSREEAKMLGFNVYRTGIPCRKGHNGWRYVSTSGCLECLGRA